MSADLAVGDDGVTRCRWPGPHADYIAYHDHEWGRPVVDDRRLFEKICLEGFQAGLSWLTILKKRSAFQIAFEGFDPQIVARYSDAERTRLLSDSAIIRNRLKVNAAIENAKRICQLQLEFGSFSAWLDAHHPLNRKEWVILFKKTFLFTGGEITGEFLMSTGYLPGAHDDNCPVYERIAGKNPPWINHEKVYLST